MKVGAIRNQVAEEGLPCGKSSYQALQFGEDIQEAGFTFPEALSDLLAGAAVGVLCG